MYQSRIRLIFRQLWGQIAWLVLILVAARYAMLSQFTDASLLAQHGTDLQRMWLFGLRYDLRIAGMALAPLLLSGLLLTWHDHGWHWWRRAAPGFIALITLIVALTAIGNYYYYQTYHRHFDIFAFGLFEDDTRAVLANIGQDYPVAQAGLLALLAAALPTWWTRRRLQQAPQHTAWSRPVFIVYLLICISLVFVIARGSLGTFPLRRSNAQVSELTVLNQLTPNAIMALDWAWKDKKKDVAFTPVTEAQGDQLRQRLGLAALTERTPTNTYLADQPPHVVMALMESLGSNMLAFDRAGENDLLGRLRPHFKQDFLFKRFLSYENGTAPSLAALLFHSPVQNISHSSAQSVDLETPFDVYKRAGYRIVFISPGNMMWRNLSAYLPRQGVDAVYDQNALLERYPEAALYMTDWGLPDEYAYRLAETLLQEAKQPLFISILSVTNHPPYVTPATYRPGPVALTPDYARHVEDGEIEQHNIQTTFQYATDALGGFIGDIKASPLGDRTLIAATGDHQMRRLRAFYPEEQALDRAVPFYLYVPEVIRQHTNWHYDPTRAGSHKDILPTLYHFSLSGLSYNTQAGRNLLAEQDDPARAFGFNVLLWIDDQGAYTLNGKPSFHPWQNAEGLALSPHGQGISPAMLERQTAYPELLRWHINRQVKGLRTD